MSGVLNDRRIEQALLFTARWMMDSCYNTGKPVYLHSLRVAEIIKNLGYGEDTIIAAILHDLLEDTDCPLESIKTTFGPNISEMVHALSINESISDRLEKNMDSIERCAAQGTAALAVKCADVADNCRFYEKADSATKDYLMKKYRYLVQICKKVMPEDPAYHVLLKVLHFYVSEEMF